MKQLITRNYGLRLLRERKAHKMYVVKMPGYPYALTTVLSRGKVLYFNGETK